jgi:hypothetical protein
VVQDLKLLRKALPATYFKNRSKIRDTLEGLEAKAVRSRQSVFSIMDGLQFLDMASRQTGSISHILKEVETRLVAIKIHFEELKTEEAELTTVNGD